MIQNVDTITLEEARRIEKNSIVDVNITSEGSLLLVSEGGAVFNIGVIGKLPDQSTGLDPAIVTTISSIDVEPYDVMVPEWTLPGLSSRPLPQPTSIPTNYGISCEWSPDARYLAISTTASPFLIIYKRSNDSLNRLPDVSGFSGSTSPSAVAWSSNGQYLAIGHTQSPWVSIFKRTGDTFTRLGNPDVLPESISGNSVRDLTWSPDSNHLALAHTSSPYITVYNRSGDIFTKIANPEVLPTSSTTAISWCPNGIHLAVGQAAGAPYFSLYKFSGGVLTRLDTSSLAAPTNENSLAWSPDGRYLACTMSTAPFLTWFKRDGDILTKLSAPAITPTSSGQDCSWSPDGRYLAVAHQSGLGISIYRRSGDTLTLTSSPINLPASPNTRGASFSSNGHYLALASQSPPYIFTFKSSMFIPAGIPTRIEVAP